MIYNRCSEGECLEDERLEGECFEDWTLKMSF